MTTERKPIYFTDQELEVVFIALDRQQFAQGQGIDLNEKEVAATDSAIDKTTKEKINRGY